MQLRFFLFGAEFTYVYAKHAVHCEPVDEIVLAVFSPFDAGIDVVSNMNATLAEPASMDAARVLSELDAELRVAKWHGWAGRRSSAIFDHGWAMLRQAGLPKAF